MYEQKIDVENNDIYSIDSLQLDKEKHKRP